MVQMASETDDINDIFENILKAIDQQNQQQQPVNMVKNLVSLPEFVKASTLEAASDMDSFAPMKKVQDVFGSTTVIYPSPPLTFFPLGANYNNTLSPSNFSGAVEPDQQSKQQQISNNATNKTPTPTQPAIPRAFEFAFDDGEIDKYYLGIEVLITITYLRCLYFY